MKRIKLFGTAVLLVLLTISCNKDRDKSRLDIRLTDAPGPYSEVNVDIQGIEITGDSGEPVALDVTPGIVNLLNFSNGADTLIGTGALEPGTISQIRLILGENNTVVHDGTTYPLSTPSAEQSGLKLQVHQVFEAGVEYSILLDFDAHQSIVQTGNGQYKLKPVIRTIDTAISGAIKGKITPAGTLATIVASSAGVEFSSPANENGDFILKGLAQGTYTLTIIHELEGSPFVMENVSVTIGHTTSVGTIEL